MVELVDTLDLGSNGFPCRFESCCPHHRKRTAVFRCPFCSIPEVKKLFRRDLQHLAQLEDHIEGNAHIAQLDGADVAAVDVHKLRELELGEPFALAVVDHIQPEPLI